MIEFTDSRTTPWESSTVASPYPKEQLTARSTSDRSVVEAPLNQLWVTPRVTSGTEVLFDLAHNMPQIAAADTGWSTAMASPGRGIRTARPPWHGRSARTTVPLRSVV